jgi:L-alanine-DL-glutamate epimerase-like enolase superfamily enzyme
VAFRRAIERSNLIAAEATLRELGRPSLGELLLLTALICRKQPARGRRVAARFLERYLQQEPDVTIEDAAAVASLLAALGGRRHDQALAALLGMTGRASSARDTSGVRSA